MGPDSQPTEYQINILWEEDPDFPGKKKFQTFSEIHLYPKVKRFVCETEVAIVDEKGNLKITKHSDPVSISKEIEVGISSNNAIELFRNHPLKNEGLKFGYVDNVLQCNTASVCLSAPTVVFVRRGVPEAAIDMTWDDLVSRSQVAGLLPLLFQAGFELLETKTSSFVGHPKGKGICAWIPETVHWGHGDFHLIFGYSIDNGITIFSPMYKNGYIGAVPCILPEPTSTTPNQPAADKKE